MACNETMPSHNKELFFDFLDALQDSDNEIEESPPVCSTISMTKRISPQSSVARLNASSSGTTSRSSKALASSRTNVGEDWSPRGEKRRRISQGQQPLAFDVPHQDVTAIKESSPRTLHIPSTPSSNESENAKPTTAPPIPSIPVFGKVKKPCKIRPKPRDKQIFYGFTFFFFPNNDVDPVRRARIILAIEHGAVWLRNWHTSVTHIIADQSVRLDEVLKHLNLEKLPQWIVAVNNRWEIDSIEWSALENAERDRYRILGSRPIALEDCGGTSIKSAAESTFPVGSNKEHSTKITTCQSKAANPMNMAQLAGADYTEGDQLQQAIVAARTLEHLPLDSDSESDGKSISSKLSNQDRGLSSTRRCPSQGRVDVSHESIIPKWQQNFACMHGSRPKETCVNSKTVEILQQMADYYESIHDVWRPIAYRKAISSLKSHPNLVISKRQAEELPNVGTRLAQKIEEIFWTNRLRRLEATRAEVTDVALRTFLQIYGVGCSQATRWVQQGLRTLDDLVAHAELSETQKIGLAHFEDFQTRIPRSEVAELGRYVTDTLLQIDEKFQVTIGGSYRRGAEDSGDVDLIISKPDVPISEIRTIILETLVPQLITKGFIKATLAQTSQDRGTKWHGACVLPNAAKSDQTWRRIDFLLVPWDEIGAARLYFTGNSIFNRSIRLLASKKGMRLNQRGLYRDVVRGPGRQKLTEGVKIEGENEQRIFELLGVPWREPEDRNC